MTNDLQQLHNEADESLVRKLSDELHRMRGGSGHLSQTAQSDAGSASVGTNTPGVADTRGDIGSNRNLPEAPASTGSGDAGEGGMVFEDGKVGDE